MAKHDFPFLRSKHEAKFILLKFNFRKLCKEPLPFLSRPFPRYRPLLYPRFSKIIVENFAYDVGIPKVIQCIFYTIIL